MIAWAAAPEIPHSARIGIAAQNPSPVRAKPAITRPAAPKIRPVIRASRAPNRLTKRPTTPTWTMIRATPTRAMVRPTRPGVQP